MKIPTGALPGKQYAIHPEFGILMMTNPTVLDIMACRGLYVKYTAGAATYPNELLLIGKAFDEYLRLAMRYAGLGNPYELTPVGLAVSLVGKKLSAVATGAQFAGASNAKGTVGLTSVSYSIPTASLQVAQVCAIPHRLLSGFFHTPVRAPMEYLGFTDSLGALVRPRSPVPAQGAQYHLVAPGHIDTPSYEYGNDGGYTLATNKEVSIPTYVGVLTTGRSYRQLATAVVNSLNLGKANISRETILSETLLALKTGLNIEADVAVPMPVIAGGYATSFRLLGDCFSCNPADYGKEEGTATGVSSTATMTHAGHPFVGALVPVGNGSFSLPTALIGDASHRGYNVRPYRLAWTTGQTALSWTTVSRSMTDTVSGIKAGQVFGFQPFSVFCDPDTGLPRVLQGDFDLAARNNALLNGGKHSDQTDPTGTFQGSTPAAIETQQVAYAQSAAAAPNYLLDPPTIAESYLPTSRTIMRLVVDSLKVDGDSIKFDRARADLILKRAPFSLVT